MNSIIDWNKALKPLLEKYKGKKHPLNYHSVYEMMVMTILAARDSDRRVNEKAPLLFEKYPTLNAMSHANVEELQSLVKGIVNYKNKSKWIIKLAQTIKDDSKIPLDLEQMIKLPGIGRKSANVIKHEAGAAPEGIATDLHTVRVSQRLGIVAATDPDKIEIELMNKLDQKIWGHAGMSMSHLGREICRPQNPKCDECVVNKVCDYYINPKK